MLKLYHKSFECIIELIAITQYFEALLKISTYHESRKGLNFPISVNHGPSSCRHMTNFLFIKFDCVLNFLSKRCFRHIWYPYVLEIEALNQNVHGAELVIIQNSFCIIPGSLCVLFSLWLRP